MPVIEWALVENGNTLDIKVHVSTTIRKGDSIKRAKIEYEVISVNQNDRILHVRQLKGEH